MKERENNMRNMIKLTATNFYQKICRAYNINSFFSTEISSYIRVRDQTFDYLRDSRLLPLELITVNKVTCS
jgi:hypothetical protein